MPFWKPKNNEEFIAQERERMDAKRRKFMDEYYKKRQQEVKQASEEEGPTTKEKIMAGAKKAGQTFKKIYEYEPSEDTKKDIRRSFKYARSEVAELGRITPRSRKRYRSGDDDEITWDQYWGGDNLGNYAESMTPQGLRMDWQGQQTGHRYSSDRYDPYIEFSGGMPTQEVGDAGFVNPLEGFDQLHFSDFTARSSGRGTGGIMADVDIGGFLDAFDPWATGKRKGSGRKRRR